MAFAERMITSETCKDGSLVNYIPSHLDFITPRKSIRPAGQALRFALSTTTQQYVCIVQDGADANDSENDLEADDLEDMHARY